MKKGLKFIYDVVYGIFRDDVGAFSAQAAFFMTISFIPFIMLAISGIKFLPLSKDALIAHASAVFPAGAKGLVKNFLEEAYQKGGAKVISITAVSSLWSASIGVFAITNGLNRVYCANETRNYILVRIASIFYTLIILIMIILCMAIFVFSRPIVTSIERYLPSFFHTALLIMSIRKILGIVVLGVFFTLIYTFAPNRRGNILMQTPGALLSGFGWVIFSSLFSFYYEHTSNYSYLYGSLSTLVFFMLWMFMCMYILFIGAEINKCLENKMRRDINGTRQV